jgi:hypothetical protein
MAPVITTEHSALVCIEGEGGGVEMVGGEGPCQKGRSGSDKSAERVGRKEGCSKKLGGQVKEIQSYKEWVEN